LHAHMTIIRMGVSNHWTGKWTQYWNGGMNYGILCKTPLYTMLLVSFVLFYSVRPQKVFCN